MTNPPEPDGDRIATLALPRLDREELERLRLQLFAEETQPVVEVSGSMAYRTAALLASRLARARREAADAASAIRAAKSIAGLRMQVAARCEQLAADDDGPASDLAFLVDAFSSVVGRGIHPRELSEWVARMRNHPLDRTATELALRRLGDAERHAIPGASGCWIMGTRQTVDQDDWARRQRALAEGDWTPRVGPMHSPPALRGRPRCLVTAIASLYRGGQYIEAFMDNLSSQAAFRDWCELIIVDAASPDDEARTIRRYMADFPNIRYLRLPDRVGIYEAWNIGVHEARGEFLTNTNLDDLRRHDSLALQAATLQSLPDVDVVYQDFYYTLAPGLSFERIATMGYRSTLPIVTPEVLLAFNPPHNAPMWRRALHDELGAFDTRYRAAGDYEFWLRCLAAGKVFHKIDDPHVAYFHNPEGMSTRTDTPGHAETRQITARYASRFLARDATPQREAPAAQPRVTEVN
ncbi:MAG: glycosyltransferase [Lautropia sp.]